MPPRDIYCDPFTFMVETVDASGKRLECVAGSTNIFAAQAAFDALVASYSLNHTLQLRQAGRIMRTEPGTGSNVVLFGGKP